MEDRNALKSYKRHDSSKPLALVPFRGVFGLLEDILVSMGLSNIVSERKV